MCSLQAETGTGQCYRALSRWLRYFLDEEDANERDSLHRQSEVGARDKYPQVILVPRCGSHSWIPVARRVPHGNMPELGKTFGMHLTAMPDTLICFLFDTSASYSDVYDSRYSSSSTMSLSMTTQQSLGNVRDGLHPVQEAIANNGTQCVFCTPG